MEKYHTHAKSQESSISSVCCPYPPREGKEAAPGSGVAGPGVDSLLHLSSNISTERDEKTVEAIVEIASILSPYWKKSAQTLYLNVNRLIDESKGLGYVGFLTLTFKENITDSKEAARRYDSFNTHFLLQDPRFGNKIAVKEPQGRGAWHYHVLIQLDQDIQSGFDFEGIHKGDYSSASGYLRKLWKDIREACSLYGFGRSEMLPIKSNGEAISRYLGGYLKKGLVRRSPEQKGVRLVNYSKGWTRNSPKFAWNTSNAHLWRFKVKIFAQMHGCSDLYQLSEKLGSNWAYKYLDDIIKVFDTLPDYVETWHEVEDDRISKETGEIQTAADWQYKDKIFGVIEENEKAKFQRLWAEVRGDLGPKDTQRQVDKKKFKKQESKNTVSRAIFTYKPKKEDIEEIKQQAQDRFEFNDWLKTAPPAPF